MSTNPNFDPLYSTNRIWRDENTERCLTDDLDAIEAELAGKAPASHTHNGYAVENHTHTPGEVGGAPANHTHSQEHISGLIASLAAKANETHDHTLAQIVGLIEVLAAKADLVDGVVPESQLPSYVDVVIEGYVHNNKFYERISDDVPSTVAIVPQSGKVYLDIDTNISYRWSGSQFVPLGSGLALGDTSATAYRGDHGKAAYEHSQNGGVHVTATEKNTWNGKQDALSFDPAPTAGSNNPVTSDGVAAALNNKAPSSHSHEMSAIAGLLAVLMTDSTGGVFYNVTSGDMLNTIKAWDKGVFTAYFAGGTAVTSLPKTTESWRCIVHKTGATFGWVLAFGTSGSVFSNYLDSGTWRGWRAIYDVSPAPLWGTSGLYMTAGHTVTPTKRLSQCSRGWMLLWADYDPDTNTSNEKDFWVTIIPNRTPSGGTWSSKLFYCDIPRLVGDPATDTSTEKRIIKQIYVSDDKIVGHDANNKGDRNDVVLRAVYEF